MDYSLASRVQLKAKVEGVCGKPSESGQHEVMHESRHNLTSQRVMHICHKVVNQESEVKQEHGDHEVDQDHGGGVCLGLPVRRDNQRSHIIIYFVCSQHFNWWWKNIFSWSGKVDGQKQVIKYQSSKKKSDFSNRFLDHKIKYLNKIRYLKNFNTVSRQLKQ